MILQKQRKEIKSLEVKVQGQRSTTGPRPYESIHMTFQAVGKNIDKEALEEVVALSTEKYCGVYASLIKGVPNVTFGVEVKEE